MIVKDPNDQIMTIWHRTVNHAIRSLSMIVLCDQQALKNRTTYNGVDVIHRRLQLCNSHLALGLVQCIQTIGIFNEPTTQFLLDSSSHTAHAAGDLENKSGLSNDISNLETNHTRGANAEQKLVSFLIL